jgi:hypothetical protein
MMKQYNFTRRNPHQPAMLSGLGMELLSYLITLLKSCVCLALHDCRLLLTEHLSEGTNHRKAYGFLGSIGNRHAAYRAALDNALSNLKPVNRALYQLFAK